MKSLPRKSYWLFAVTAMVVLLFALAPANLARAVDADDHKGHDHEAAKPAKPAEKAEEELPKIDDPLEELKKIADKMEGVETDLGDKKVDKPVQDKQKDIIRDLSALIKFAEEQEKKQQQQQQQQKQQRCKKCAKKSKQCKSCAAKQAKQSESSKPAKKSYIRSGGKADKKKDAEDRKTTIKHREKEFEEGRRLDEEEIPEGFEELLERFFKIVSEIDDKDSE